MGRREGGIWTWKRSGKTDSRIRDSRYQGFPVDRNGSRRLVDTYDQRAILGHGLSPGFLAWF